MPFHVIRDNGDRRCTSKTFRTERAADRERDAWISAGWTAVTIPDTAPRATCGRPSCARRDDHTH